MAYTTSELDAIVRKLESHLEKGYAEVSHDGQRLVYRSTDEILKGITYFKAQYDNASDAPTPAAPKIRTLLGYTNPGFSSF